MLEASSFADAIRDVLDELATEPASLIRLNHAAARVDHLGRRLHGLGWVRDREIGACLTAAVSELGRARALPEADRPAAVGRAVLLLEDALRHAEEGLRPERP